MFSDMADASSRARFPSFHRDRFTDMGSGDDEGIDIEVVIIFSVGDGRLKDFAHGPGDSLGREMQDIQGFLDGLRANRCSDEVELAGTGPQQAPDGKGFIILKATGMGLFAHGC